MGYEFRIATEPRVKDLDEFCEKLFDGVAWTRIPTSFGDVAGIGVQAGEVPVDPSWPHAADIHQERDGQIYIVCHCGQGVQFLQTLIASLKEEGFRVNVDDDV